jgi:thiol-disulfide isomerase/thioredoxin
MTRILAFAVMVILAAIPVRCQGAATPASMTSNYSPLERDVPTILAFWSPDCAPCLDELQALQAVHSGYWSEVEVIGVVRPGDAAEAMEAAKKRGVTFSVVANNLLWQRYDVTGVPQTLLLHDGEIVRRWRGKVLARELVDELEALD